MIDTVLAVKPRTGDKTPGFITLSSGGEFSTFDDGALHAAQQNIGQRVEYDVTIKTTKAGRVFKNISGVKGVASGSLNPILVGSAPMSIGSATGILATPAVDITVVTAQIKRIADSLDKLIAVVASQVVSTNGGPEPIATTPVEERDEERSRAKLAAKVGKEAANAMIAALKAKHRDFEKFSTAVEALLVKHGA